MKDGIIKGRGDSRYLKSVADFLTRYPDYGSFAQALITGTLPVDFNGVNPEGWTQMGTPLDKASLLSDTTADMLGLGSSATVNDGLAAALPKNGGAMTGALYDIGGPPLEDAPEEGFIRADTAQVRNISAGTTDLTPGESSLATGEVYLVYEVD